MKVYVDVAGLGAGQYTLTVRADASREAGVTQIDPADHSGAHCPWPELIRRRVCSAPTAFAAPPAAIRSIAPTVRRLGAALVRAAFAEHRRDRALPPTAISGCSSAATRASRASGSKPSSRIGAAGEGATVTSAGVVPTPAIAYLTRTAGYDAGVVISASHNPFEDNGIKVFSGRGEKFTERVEREVEAIVADPSWSATSGEAGPVARADLVGAYLEHLRAVFPEASDASRAKSFKLGVDCANGATTTVAPLLFAELGFETVVIGDKPDGRNINLNCGSTHPERLAKVVVEQRMPGRRGVRRRRRPRDLRRPSRPGRERRRRAVDVRAAAAAGRTPQGPRDRRDRDEQHRPRARAPRASASSSCGARSATST